ncbi:MAG: glycosyltransferase family 39 protein [Patescibacteria group bacterium]
MEFSAYVKRNWHVCILTILACFFFFVYSWLHFQTENTFTSPDETANYFFSSLFSENNSLRYDEPLNDAAGGIVVPRSMIVTPSGTVPASFLGLPLLYGFLAKVAGSGYIFLFTPFFAVVGVICFYLLCKEFFPKNISFIASLLMFALPPFWYFSSRGLFHNVLFLVFLIIGLLLLIYSLTRQTSLHAAWFYNIGSGIAIGLALITRTSEITWVIPVVAFILIINRRHVQKFPLIGFVGALLIACVVLLVLNNSLYGSPLAFGYSAESTDLSSIKTASQSILLKFEKLLFPFGLNFERIQAATIQYLLLFFPLYAFFIVIGLAASIRSSILALVKKKNSSAQSPRKAINWQYAYTYVYAAVVLWLILYYGSYVFYEYIDRTEILLGSSYLRYWLPIFVFGLPFCAQGIQLAGSIFRSNCIKRTVMVGSFMALVIFSVNTVLNDPLQGLFAVRKNISESVSKLHAVLGATEPNAVLIAGYADKVFFPERRVIVQLPDKNTQHAVQTILDQAPLYYLFNPLDSMSGSVMEFFSANDYLLRSTVSFQPSNEILYSIKTR